jgi:hypothetical protein
MGVGITWDETPLTAVGMILSLTVGCSKQAQALAEYANLTGNVSPDGGAVQSWTGLIMIDGHMLVDDESNSGHMWAPSQGLSREDPTHRLSPIEIKQ